MQVAGWDIDACGSRIGQDLHAAIPYHAEQSVKRLRAWLKNLYLEARSLASAFPLAYDCLILPIMVLRPRQRWGRFRRGTVLVIEGFPRSANSWFTAHFDLTQGEWLQVASHMHDAIQVTRAERQGIPAIVLVREPAAAVASTLLREPDLSAGAQLRRYRRFYEEIAHHHQAALIVTFEEATSDPDAVIARLNRLRGTQFRLGGAIAAQSREIVRQSDIDALGEAGHDPLRSALPSAEKDAARSRLVARIETDHRAELTRCRTAYHRMLALHEAQLGADSEAWPRSAGT